MLKKIHIGYDFIILLSLLIFFDDDNIMLFFIVSAFVHELAHLFAFLLCGAKIERISLSCMGANITLAEFPMLSYLREALCILCGPLANFLLSFICYLSGFYLLAGINIILCVFNLIPASRFDGGRIIMLFCQRFFTYRTAYTVLGVLSFLSVIAIIPPGIYLLILTKYNVSLLLAGCFLLFSMYFDYFRGAVWIKN